MFEYPDTILLDAQSIINYILKGYFLKSRWLYGDLVAMLTKPGEPTIYLKRGSGVTSLLRDNKITSIRQLDDSEDFYLND